MAARHALITGSSRGIGRGISLKLAEDHVKVAVHYYQNEQAAKETLAEVRKRGSRNWHTRWWTPMGRLGTPEDVGNVVALFCSERAGWITGQVIYADGGASLMNPEVPTEIQIG